MGCGSSKVDVEDVNYVKNVKAKYVLGDLLGEGASCSVVKATDTNGDKHYAVKMLERKGVRFHSLHRLSCYCLLIFFSLDGVFCLLS